jgi:orotate phosphoribosyltransferase
MGADGPVGRQLLLSLAARRGHFLLESGHHGDLWLDLAALLATPSRVAPAAAELARRLSRHALDAVCGPLVGGAFVAQMVAAELDVECSWAERVAGGHGGGLYAARYRIPEALRGRLAGRAVAVVDDVVNAGSASRATVADLRACGARPVAIGALLVLGAAIEGFAAEEGLAVETVARLENALWAPRDCPLCADGVALEAPAG